MNILDNLLFDPMIEVCSFLDINDLINLMCSNIGFHKIIENHLKIEFHKHKCFLKFVFYTYTVDCFMIYDDFKPIELKCFESVLIFCKLYKHLIPKITIINSHYGNITNSIYRFSCVYNSNEFLIQKLLNVVKNVNNFEIKWCNLSTLDLNLENILQFSATSMSLLNVNLDRFSSLEYFEIVESVDVMLKPKLAKHLPNLKKLMYTNRIKMFGSRDFFLNLLKLNPQIETIYIDGNIPNFSSYLTSNIKTIICRNISENLNVKYAKILDIDVESLNYINVNSQTLQTLQITDHYRKFNCWEKFKNIAPELNLKKIPTNIQQIKLKVCNVPNKIPKNIIIL